MATSLQGAATKQDAGSTRKRIIYQSESLFAGKEGTPEVLRRIQSANYSFTVPRQDVSQYGQLGQIERVIVEVPTVNLDFTYNLWGSDGGSGKNNEQVLFGTTACDTTGSRGIMYNVNSDSDIEKQRYQICLSNEGTDYFGTGQGSNKAIIIDNGFLSSTSWTGSVGDVPSATVNVESTKMRMATPDNSPTAAADSATTPRVLRPGNVTFTATGSMSNSGASNVIPALGVDVLHVQSFTISMDMPRESISRLGDKFEYARVITFPLQATLSMEAIVSTQAADNLNEIVGTDSGTASDPGYVIDVSCGKEGTTGVYGMGFRFKDAKVEGHSFSTSIGANKSVTLDFAVQVDAGSAAYSAVGGAGFWVKQIA
jgi:hypothetical protein